MDRLAERRARSKTPVKNRETTPDFMPNFHK
jgi:hypothetical protein